MNQRNPRLLAAAATATSVAFVLLTSVAHADESTQGRRLPVRPGAFSLKVEPGLAVALSRPQSRLFELGGGQTVKGFWALNRYLDLGPSLTYLTLPAEASEAEAGTAWTFGASLRVKRPHDVPDFAISPWADLDLLYVRTDELNRPGFAGAVGLAVPVGRERIFWLGPFVRYLHIFQGTRDGFDDRDAKILSIGISLEVGSGVRREPYILPSTSEVRTVDRPVMSCPDRDADGAPDNVDRCPDAAGPMDNWGCPAYEKLIVKRDKLELKEKLYFAYDQATLQPESYPLLDEVVRALKDNKSFRVQVEGHSSSEGTPDHNQTLSEGRARAVLDYLAAHGIEKERLVSKGFASSVPIDTNETAAGRENNRRVEFVVNFIILDQGTPVK